MVQKPTGTANLQGIREEAFVKLSNIDDNMNENESTLRFCIHSTLTPGRKLGATAAMVLNIVQAAHPRLFVTFEKRASPHRPGR